MRISYGAIARGEYRSNTDQRLAKKDRECNGHARKLTDEQIKELRALMDYRGWEAIQIQTRYGIDADTARRYMQGITRAKLKYSEEDLPDEYK